MFIATVIVCAALLSNCFVASSRQEVESFAQKQLVEIKEELETLERDFAIDITNVFVKPQALGDELIGGASNANEAAQTSGYVLKAVSLSIGQLEMARYAIGRSILDSLSKALQREFVDKSRTVAKLDYNENLVDLLRKRANEHIVSDRFDRTINEWKLLQTYMETYEGVMRENPRIRSLVAHAADLILRVAKERRAAKEETLEAVDKYGNGLTFMQRLSKELKISSILQAVDGMLAIQKSKTAEGVAELIKSSIEPSLLAMVEQVNEQIEHHVVEPDDLDEVDLHKFDGLMAKIREQEA